jgi:hypothetical protein
MLFPLQLVQLVAPAFLANLPLGQRVQVLAPAEEKDPAVQVRHEFEPVSGE